MVFGQRHRVISHISFRHDRSVVEEDGGSSPLSSLRPANLVQKSQYKQEKLNQETRCLTDRAGMFDNVHVEDADLGGVSKDPCSKVAE